MARAIPSHSTGPGRSPWSRPQPIIVDLHRAEEEQRPEPGADLHVGQREGDGVDESTAADVQLPPCPGSRRPRRASTAITSAADPSRTAVKLEASIAPPRSASRQRSEFPAKQSIASDVSRAVFSGAAFKAREAYST